MAKEAQFGVQPAQLTSISATWRREAGDLTGLVWSALSEVGGEGSAVLAAVRDSADPARQAAVSIASRFTTMAELVDKFAGSIAERDAEIAAEFGKLEAR
ncbi:hypothetical protein [Nocardia sp. XZ_19_385]|uniref:hypothetical protein n=1 Tax=Nocardia sp. XZ_19_385 TaxID=2769488 RepID=UPI00188FBE5D|nr:hypothetical protein [Nocardia sp. XZ_19_385]